MSQATRYGFRSGSVLATSMWVRRLRVCVVLALLVLVAQQALHPTPTAAAPVVVTPSSLTVTEVSAADTGTCYRTAAGEVGCWGGYTEAPPSGTGPLTAVSVSTNQICAVKQDRSILCWGGGYDADSMSGSFLTVSAGYFLHCAVEVDHDVVCWSPHRPDQPEHIDGPFDSVDVGDSHACAVRVDGTITCWGGGNDRGEAPRDVAGTFVAVSASSQSTCALEADGDVGCWGDNSNGQAPATVKGPFTMLGAGNARSCALRASGAVSCWGAPLSGSSGDVAGPFRTVATGGSHVCAIGADDRLNCWGDSYEMPTPPGNPSPAQFVPATEAEPYLQLFTVRSASSVSVTVQGALPPGLSISDDMSYKDFALTGTPSTRGTYRFTLVATNLFGTATLPVTLRVIPAAGSFDVNADGIPDLPVGASGEDVGSRVDAGQVTVLLGATDGSYGRKGAVTITQETLGHHSERGDRFGAAIATGEISGDDYVDLIIGVPGEDKGAGQVIVLCGSAKGLAGGKRVALRQGSGAAGAAEAGDGFGSAISVGDGLWVGAPGEDLGSAIDAGVATKFLIAPLRTAGSAQYQQGAGKIPGSPEKGDRFGAALAGGGAMIGAPGEDVGKIADAGSVTWLLRYALTQDSDGVPGSAEAGDQFGAALAISAKLLHESVDGDWYFTHDIGIGAPGEDIGSSKDAGMVIWGSSDIFYGDDDESGGVESMVQDDWSPSARSEPGDRFGSSITISADAHRIVVGAPGEDVGSTKDAGAVSILSFCDSCPNGADLDATLDQNSSGVPGSVRAGSQFGAMLTERPGTAGGYVVSAPGEMVSGKAGAGAVIVMPTKGTPQELHQDSPGVPDSAETADRFGIVPAG